MKKISAILLISTLLTTLFVGCERTKPVLKEQTLTLAAAASLEYSFEEKLIPMFLSQNPGVSIDGVYDASGKLQTQIEEGLEADVFISAATKQMTALTEKKLVNGASVLPLLENKIILIAPVDSKTTISSFEEIINASTIGIGDPESVPVGQYSKEALVNLGVWDVIQPKVSLGTNVTEVLTWVSEGSAEVGIVYATDAATTNKVKVIAYAPEGSLAEKIVYPIGVTTSSEQLGLAQAFLEFLCSDEASAVFIEYGFTPYK